MQVKLKAVNTIYSTRRNLVTWVVNEDLERKAKSLAAAAKKEAGILFVDSLGNTWPDDLLIADAGNRVVRKVVATLVGSGTPGSIDVTGTAAIFNKSAGLAMSLGGMFILVADQHKVCMVLVATGAVTTVAGTSALFDTISGLLIVHARMACLRQPQGAEARP